MPPWPEADAALCRRAADGDSGAFSLLVATHERRLRAFLAHVAGSDVADELAQEAFVRCWQSLHSYRGDARFFSWLCAIAWRCFLDHARRERSDIRRRDAAALEAEAAYMPSQTTMLDLRVALARLKPVERAALVLCDGHGWSHAEAAATLGVPLGTLKGSVRRAKRKCREFLEATEHG